MESSDYEGYYNKDYFKGYYRGCPEGLYRDR